jgi:hypothetical protein
MILAALTYPYFMLLYNSGDPRLADGSLTVFEMNFIEAPLFLFAWISIFVFWFYALYKTYQQGHYGWLAVSFLFWIIYPVYFWKLTKGIANKPVHPTR